MWEINVLKESIADQQVRVSLHSFIAGCWNLGLGRRRSQILLIYFRFVATNCLTAWVYQNVFIRKKGIVNCIRYYSHRKLFLLVSPGEWFVLRNESMMLNGREWCSSVKRWGQGLWTHVVRGGSWNLWLSFVPKEILSAILPLSSPSKKLQKFLKLSILSYGKKRMLGFTVLSQIKSWCPGLCDFFTFQMKATSLSIAGFQLYLLFIKQTSKCFRSSSESTSPMELLLPKKKLLLSVKTLMFADKHHQRTPAKLQP